MLVLSFRIRSQTSRFVEPNSGCIYDDVCAGLKFPSGKLINKLPSGNLSVCGFCERRNWQIVRYCRAMVVRRANDVGDQSGIVGYAVEINKCTSQSPGVELWRDLQRLFFGNSFVPA